MENSLARVTSILCIPYGYTVTLWCAGAWTVTRYGLPGRSDVFLFASGAVVAFLALAVVGRPHLDTEIPMRVPALVVLNAFPLLAVGIALGVPQGAVSRGVAFLVSSFLATAAYVLSLTALLHMLQRRSRTGE